MPDTNPERGQPCLLRLLRSTPMLAVAVATLWYLAEHRQANSSLQDALGDIAFWWQVAIAATHLAIAVLGCLPERPPTLRVQGWLNILAATTLVGYALGIILTPPPGQSYSDQVSTAVGLAVGAVCVHILHWRQIETEQIPTLYQLAAVTAAPPRPDRKGRR